MEELKPCPFCGIPGIECSRPENHKEGCWIRLYADDCEDYYALKPLQHGGKERKKAWNTRHERTCNMTKDPDFYEEYYPVCRWQCSVCGKWVKGNDYKPWYPLCPYCGAVVES